MDTAVNFKVDSHDNGYYLHGVVEILPATPGVSKVVPKRSVSEDGIYSQMKSGYDSLINAFIRPPRAHYDEEKLGPVHFMLYDRFACRRTDLVLKNKYGKHLQCSHYDRDDLPPDQRRPCVVP